MSNKESTFQGENFSFVFLTEYAVFLQCGIYYKPKLYLNSKKGQAHIVFHL